MLEEGNDDLTTIKTYQRGRYRRQEIGEVLSSEGLSITPLAHVSPPTQKSVRLKEVARSWAKGSEVEQDVQYKKGDTVENFSDTATNIAALIDVAIPLLEKKQHGIRADMVGAGELSCSNGGSDAEGDDAIDIVGRLEAAPIQDEAGCILQEDSETFSDIDDDEVLILFLSLARLHQRTRPPALSNWLGLVQLFVPFFEFCLELVDVVTDTVHFG